MTRFVYGRTIARICEGEIDFPSAVVKVELLRNLPSRLLPLVPDMLKMLRRPRMLLPLPLLRRLPMLMPTLKCSSRCKRVMPLLRVRVGMLPRLWQR